MPLYHYTSTQGCLGILKDSIIYYSTDLQNDAVLGRGVYFTSLPPDTSTERLLHNNWDLSDSQAEGRIHCLEYCIEVNSAHLSGAKNCGGSRDIWVYPWCVDLSLIPHKIRARGKPQAALYTEINQKDLRERREGHSSMLINLASDSTSLETQL